MRNLSSDARTCDEAFAKCDKIGRETLRLLPVQSVPRALVYHEPRAIDGSQKRVLITSRTEPVPVASENERGRFDPVQLPGKIVFQEAFERRSPNPCRNL